MKLLSEDTKNDPRGIEVHFATKFDALRKYAMSDDLAGITFGLMFATDEIIYGGLEKLPITNVVKARLEAFGYTMEPKLVLFLGYLTESNAAIAVMYSTYLAWWCKQHDKLNVEFEEFMSDIFGDGFPSEEDMSNLWYEQKVVHSGGDSDNLLDYLEAASSILAKQEPSI